MPTPYLTIRDAATATGLSQRYLRDGCRAGTVPHIRSGSKYYIYVPALLAELEAQAKSNGGGQDVDYNG